MIYSKFNVWKCYIYQKNIVCLFKYDLCNFIFEEIFLGLKEIYTLVPF